MIRRDAIARMRTMDDPRIREMLATDQESYTRFGRELAERLTSEGIPSSFDKGQWFVNGEVCRLEAFYYRRSIPDAMARLVRFVRDQDDGRNPWHRPGNFFEESPT